MDKYFRIDGLTRDVEFFELMDSENMLRFPDIERDIVMENDTVDTMEVLTNYFQTVRMMRRDTCNKKFFSWLKFLVVESTGLRSRKGIRVNEI